MYSFIPTSSIDHDDRFTRCFYKGIIARSQFKIEYVSHSIVIIASNDN